MDKLLKLDKTGYSRLLKEIKKSLGLKLDDELFLFSGKDYLVIKKVQIGYNQLEIIEPSMI